MPRHAWLGVSFSAPLLPSASMGHKVSDCPLVSHWCSSPRDIQIPGTTHPRTFGNICPGSGSCQVQSRNGSRRPTLGKSTNLSAPPCWYLLCLLVSVFLCSGSQSLRAIKSPKKFLLENPAHFPGSALQDLAAKAWSQSPCPTLLHRY